VTTNIWNVAWVSEGQGATEPRGRRGAKNSIPLGNIIFINRPRNQGGVWCRDRAKNGFLEGGPKVGGARTSRGWGWRGDRVGTGDARCFEITGGPTVKGTTGLGVWGIPPK